MSLFQRRPPRHPFGATFAWRALETHPDGGEWYIPHRVYGDPLRQKLEDLAKRLGAQKRRMMAEQAESGSEPTRILQRSPARGKSEKNIPENVQPEPQGNPELEARAYPAELFTAKGMRSGYALSSSEQIKYISPASSKPTIEPVDYLGMVDKTLLEVGLDSSETMCRPVSNLPSPYSDMLDLIAKGEGGYNSMNNGTSNNRIINSTHDASVYLGENLTDMSLDKIMVMQQGSIGAGRKIFAAGRYQMIPTTLKSAVQSSGVNAGTKFTPQTQDRLAIQLIENRKPLADYLNGNHNDIDAAMLSMSKEWASIPNPKTGKSYYGNGNKSMHSVDEVKKVLIDTRNAIANAK